MTLPNSDLKIPRTSKESSFKIVRNTIESLRNLIETQPWNDLKSLVILVHQKAKMYERSVSDSTPTLHVCLRILKIAREEALKVLLGGNADFEENSTNRLFASGDTTYETIVKSDLLDGVLSALDEFLVDINTCSENISDLSLDLIHSDELILTRGFSQAAYHFLRRAAEKKRMFKVIVCEGYPDNLGHKFAEDLSKEGINVILVPDSHAFGLMSRVNKVIIGCNVVYPDGTMKAPIGTHSVLLAAKHFTIPTYVCLPQYKLSPLPLKMSDNAPPLFTVLPTADPCNSSPDWLDGPTKILPIDDPVVTSSDLSHRSLSNGPVVWMPRWELIPAGLVNLFLTNLGSHAPSYLYALGRELFHPLDIQMAISAR
ncbi:Translation initiation factor eIF-2B subunit beta [Paragonimus heterotremus]|uniref:Translation initiation factor eIF2B subunit beta n=1 Tax=Paragonimus heterotremus TaxID=100268 RepID=A0A8J4T2N5_9TREM|nr:Translation initiation factor eIF-2B subunit beta [Paragonimus heterotremus]